jgi:hypothetical protein
MRTVVDSGQDVRMQVDQLRSGYVGRRGFVAVAAFLVAASLAPSAGAAHTPGHPPPAAIEQYIEQVPTSQGSRPAGVGKARKRPLPQSVRQRLVQQGGTDAPTLERIATDPTLGAPARKLKRPKGYAERAATTDDPDASRALSAAVEAAGSGSDARIIGLLVALVAITVLVGGLALWQRRAGE